MRRLIILVASGARPSPKLFVHGVNIFRIFCHCRTEAVCRAQDSSAATVGQRSILRRFLLAYSRYARRNCQNLPSLSHRFAIEYLSPTDCYPRNQMWFKRNPWFAEDVLPFLRFVVKQTVLE